MKLAELQKKIADVLGVSSSQKELAFEIFVDKIAEILLEHITLKVPRVGYFQLKVSSSKSESRPLIFAPLSEDFSRESRNLYLTIDVAPRVRDISGADSNIFSIGVGKPLLPLSIDELPDTETSYAMLKKSIEERVKELLMESDQIPNFNIWDDYYKSPNQYEDDSPEGPKSQLYTLTSDLSFDDEIIPDKIPESISNNYNPAPAEENNTSEFDYADLFLEVNKTTEEPYNFDELLVEEKAETEEIPAYELYQPETPEEPVVPADEISDAETYSELNDLQLEEITSDSITITDLLADHVPVAEKEKNFEINEIEEDESSVPFESVMPRMLVEESSPPELPLVTVSDGVEEESDENEDESGTNRIPGGSALDDVVEIKMPESIPSPEFEPVEEDKPEIQIETGTDRKKSFFDELDELSREVNSLQVNEDDNFEKIVNDDEEEKIEWNWGDELKEEFGIPAFNEENEEVEMTPRQDEEKEGDLKIVDDYLDDESTTHDLFSRLEKTLEREFEMDEPPKRKLTGGDKRTTLDRNKLKKVVMEFSGPPAKYEFIEDRPAEGERRMAITLVDNDGVKRPKKISDTDEDIKEESKNSYFGKMFLITAGIFLVIGAVVLFMVLSGDSTKKSGNVSSPAVQTNKIDSGKTENLTQINTPSRDTSAAGYDELSDFPRTATPPVPIKDATDKQILETIKNETARLQSQQKSTDKPAEKEAAKPPNVKQGKNTPENSATTDTKVSNRVYSDGKNFFLQVSSWPNKIRAEEEVNRLRGLGFNGFIIEANLPQKGGIWYRVRVGPFKSASETEEFMKKNNL